MNHLSKLIVTLTSIISLEQATFADTITCPTVDTVKSRLEYADINHNVLAEPDKPSFYSVMQSIDFDTQHVFWFIIIDIPATSQADALAKAKNALPTLVSTSTTAKLASSDSKYKSVCTYSIGNGYKAVALLY